MKKNSARNANSTCDDVFNLYLLFYSTAFYDHKQIRCAITTNSEFSLTVDDNLRLLCALSLNYKIILGHDKIEYGH